MRSPLPWPRRWRRSGVSVAPIRNRAWLAVVLALVAGSTGVAAAAPRSGRLKRVRTWAFAIGDGGLAGNLTARYAAYDLVVLDGQQASAAQVRALRRAGKIVLAYLDVGTIEPHRPWYAALKPYRLDYWPDWGEWYANVARSGFRTEITETIAPRILRKGFDGLFLDNTDMIESHPRQTSGMRSLVRGLARLVHRRGDFLFAQNGEDSIGPLLRYYDGWNREDVSATYDFARHRYVRQSVVEVSGALRALRRIGAAGLLTLATDYTAAGAVPGVARSIADACSAGALPFVSDINLRRVPVVPAHC